MAAGTPLVLVAIFLAYYFSFPLLIVNSTKEIAEMLGGIDLSWLVGLLSTAILYYVLAKRAQIKVSKILSLNKLNNFR